MESAIACPINDGAVAEFSVAFHQNWPTQNRATYRFWESRRQTTGEIVMRQSSQWFRENSVKRSLNNTIDDDARDIAMKFFGFMPKSSQATDEFYDEGVSGMMAKKVRQRRGAIEYWPQRQIRAVQMQSFTRQDG